MANVSDSFLEKAIHGFGNRPRLTLAGLEEDLGYHRKMITKLNAAFPLTKQQRERLAHHQAEAQRIQQTINLR
ncbi:hypothetical protein [Idiomarina loihiensis]|uniref:hypothetical protein n=1 Tax=Idiomarina loihiensis TaxID=135577 RepID=UPI0031583BB7